MDDALRERLEALERAVTDGEHDLSAFADDAAAVERLDTLEADVEDLADRVEELEAATQALRGYVGNIRSVNTEVEQRADAALAKAEALEDRLPEATATTSRQPSAATNGHDASTAGDTPDGSDSSTGPDDRGGTDDPAGNGEAAVDEWEWVTDDPTVGTGGTHADGTAGTGADGTAGIGAGGTAGTGAGGSTDANVDGTSASDGERERTPSRDEPAAATADPPSGNDTAPPRHGGGAGHGRSEATPADGERAGRTHQRTDGRRCASCGRPHSSDGGSATRDAPGWEPPGVPGEGGAAQGATTTDRGQAAGARHATTGDGATAGHATTDPASGDDTTPGAPTVAEIAESDPAEIGADDGAPGDDGDIVPDGSEDPLIGAGDGDDRPGTLQRIRDLL